MNIPAHATSKTDMSARWHRWEVFGSLCVGLFLYSEAAHAEDSAARPVIVDRDGTIAQPPPNPNLPSRKPWVLFDPHRSQREVYLQGGYATIRTVDTQEVSRGFSLALGNTMTNLRGPLYVGGRVQYELRFYERNVYWFGAQQYSYQAGLALGPIQWDARVGVTLLHVDLADGSFSLGGLSPRAATGLSVVLGNARIGFEGYTELLWRWFGEANLRSHGLTIEFTTKRDKEKPATSR